jgi:osmotically-inducible protein OsmY
MRHIGYVAAGLAASCALAAGTAWAHNAGSGDTQISREVASDLIKDTALGPYGVQVRSHDGRVEMTGSVLTARDWNKAAEDARNVEGVGEVQNNLSILTR